MWGPDLPLVAQEQLFECLFVPFEVSDDQFSVSTYANLGGR
jgi:hypothetical protein